MRTLLEANNSTGECVPGVYQAALFPYAYTGHSAVFVAELVGIFYCLLALAILCDKYFVESLQIICTVTRLSPDVAGATWMAIGSSAPELFSSLAASLNPGSLVSLGTIMGSGIFNVTVIYAVAIFAAGRGAKVKVSWRPLIRDTAAFVLSLIVVYFVVSTGDEVLWYEGLDMLLLYAGYILLMKYNSQVMAFMDKLARICGYTGEASETTAEQEAPAGKAEQHEISISVEEASKDPPPVTWKSRVYRVVAFPLTLLFRWTVVDCRKDERRKWFPLTFAISVIYLAVICQFLVSWSLYFGCFLSIPDEIMGLTLLAAGSSIPELFSSSVVAKQGRGDMIISNSLGSNVFNNLVGLGLPWFIFALVRGKVETESQGLIVYVGILLVVVALILTIICASKFVLSRGVAGMLLGIYALFLVLAALFSFPAANPVLNLNALPAIRFPTL